MNVRVCACLLLVTAVVAGVLNPASMNAAEPQTVLKAEQAFAALKFGVIKGTTVQGTKRLYTPFYSYMIWPHVVAARGVQYCAFQNTQGQPVVMAYTAKTARWQGPVTAATNGLGPDAHGNPSLYIDETGYLHIFYGCHNTPLRHVRSARPYDITEWEHQEPPVNKVTYPQTMRMQTGEVGLFYRAGGHMEPWTMVTSSDACKTWSKPQPIIEMRLDPPDKLAAAYVNFIPGVDRKTVHCFWVHKDDNPGAMNRGRLDKHPWRPLKYPGLHEAVYRYNLYYMKRDAEGVWRNADDRKMKLPVSKADADRYCMVYDSGDTFCRAGEYALDDQDRPYVAFSTGVTDWTTGLEEKQVELVPQQKKFARYADGDWQIAKTMPGQWPANVQATINASGAMAAGDGSGGNWSMFFSRNHNMKDIGCVIYLQNAQGEYASRPDGPAIIP